MKTLLIVESPAKVKTIQKYLGSEFVIRASVGHIRDLSAPENGHIGVDIKNNFTPKYKMIQDKKDIIKLLIDSTIGMDQILLATDPDREGEAIAWHIAELLKSSGKPIKRVEFHEITKTQILEQIEKPRDIDVNLFYSQQARRVLDRIVGYLVSPMLSKTLGGKLSAGRVQSVAAKLVVDREREIENFKPEEYWNIFANLIGEAKQSFLAKYSKNPSSAEECDKIVNHLKTDDFIVSKVEKKQRKRQPYPPFITSSLAATAATIYKFPAARTMKAAQTLYENGFITYMRTDSLRSAPEAIISCREWIQKNNYKVPLKPNYYKNKDSAQDAHEAIRPTNVNKLPEQMSGSEDEVKIYKLIWQRFISSQMNPAIFDMVKIDIKSSSGHLLTAKGQTLVDKGWLVFQVSDDQEDELNSILPIMGNKEKLSLCPPGITSEQKFTQPSARFSENTLIKELEKRGIGRPSTYASIMSTITGRGYIERKKEAFVPTDLGKQIIDKLSKDFGFLKYDYTAEMESKLDQIAKNKLTYLQMMQDFYNSFIKELKKSYVTDQKDYGIQCEICRKPMRLKSGMYGLYMACEDYPDCNYTYSCDMVDGSPVKKDFRRPVVEGIYCPKCQSGMIIKNGQFGPFYSCSKYPKCNGNRKIPFGKQCSDCGEELFATILKGKLRLACMGYPDCTHIEDLPEDSNLEWINPKDIQTQIPKETKKILAIKI